MLHLLIRRLKTFRDDLGGVGAVEFAIVAPFLLILYVGCVDATRAVTFHWKLQQATTALNDLISQSETLDKTKVLASIDIADAMLAPYKVTDLGVTVKDVRVDEHGSAKVVWSLTRGVDRGSSGAMYTLPPEMRSLRNVTLIVTDMSYDYPPLMKSVLKHNISMAATARGRFRGRKEVVCSNCAS